MFTNRGKPNETPVAADLTPKRPAPSRIMTSIIANGVRIEGSIFADGAEIQVDGEIEGNLRGGAITVGETGFVKGDIVSESVTVNGRIEGTVRARKVTLSRTAHALGDITHQQLSMEMGAVFDGQCKYVQDPLKLEGVGGAPQLSAPAPAQDSGADADRPFSGIVVTGAG